MLHRLSYMLAGIFTVSGAWGIITMDKGYVTLIQGGLIYLLAYMREHKHHRPKA